MQTDPLEPDDFVTYTLEFIADRSCPDCDCYIGDFTTPCPTCALCPKCGDPLIDNPEYAYPAKVCRHCDFAPLVSRETEARDKARMDWDGSDL